MITLSQCNILDGGKWNGWRRGDVTYDTARRFAQFVASVNPPGHSYPPISLIGIQEVVTEADRAAIEGFLKNQTAADWESERVPQGVNGGSGIGMFWRSDMVETHPEWKLGETEVERLDNGYSIKFAGRLFRDLSDGSLYALFTGKFAWQQGILNGHTITEEERRLEILRFTNWARQSVVKAKEMMGWPSVVSAVAVDLNTKPGSPAWREMDRDYYEPSRQPTFNSFEGKLLLDLFGRRLDYLWLERDTGATFCDGPRRSPHFGSDHRAVYATIGARQF